MSTALPLNLQRPPKLDEPQLRGDEMTPERYIDAGYLRREWQQVWRRVWNTGGVSYQMPDPGDYLMTELGPESIIMVRQEDGGIRAFHNACPHRGTRITEAPEGHTKKFQCPYHGWEFNTAGLVIAVPAEDDFPQGSPCGTKSLKEVRCEEMFGIVWYNLDPEAPSLTDFLGETVVKELKSHRMEEMVRVLDMTVEAACNWKIITDNFNEAYHVKVLHPELVPYIAADHEDCQFDLLPGGHNRGWFPSFMPSAEYSTDVIGEPLVSMAAAWGVDSNNYVGRDSWKKIRTDIQAEKRRRGTERGYRHYEHLADYQLTDYVIYNLFPNNVITVGPDGVQLLRPRPHATDPAKCLFDHWWLVNRVEGQNMTPSPAGGPDLPVEDAEHELVVYGEKTLGTTADQDLSVASSQQRGLGSAGFQGYYLPHQERRLQHFHEVLNDYMK
jgi:phenylpropionate dioxygenase-like ring-hydroxylating dioxygenase large terminal subunit